MKLKSVIVGIVMCLNGKLKPNHKIHVLYLQVLANGEGTHPVFTWLKSKLPTPSDDPESMMGDPKFIIWKPVKRSDIAWNFEKFLIGKDGKAIKRFSKSFQTANVSKEIDTLI